MSEELTGVVRSARPDDLPQMQALLAANGLPTEGVPDHVRSFLVAEQAGALHGMVGLEVYGDAALLRSLAVHESVRGSGLGALLVRMVEDAAARGGVQTLVLLTTTAASWFPRFGYTEVSREAVPVSVTASAEFQGACPASATVMQKSLAPD